MRKKSHFALCKYILACDPEKKIIKHKLPFIWGGLKPDCTPSFFFYKHEYYKHFNYFEWKIKRMCKGRGLGIWTARNLGIVSHWTADFFTYPHQDFYPEGFVGHCYHEGSLKFAMRYHCRDCEKESLEYDNVELNTAEEIIEYVKQQHEEYKNCGNHSVENDVEWICRMGRTVVRAVINIRRRNRNRQLSGAF